jgi:hypothetical protein
MMASVSLAYLLASLGFGLIVSVLVLIIILRSL